MQKHEAGLHLEQDPALNQSTWMMCSVVDQKEISLSVLVQLGITVVIRKMLVSSVEVNVGKKYFVWIYFTLCNNSPSMSC